MPGNDAPVDTESGRVATALPPRGGECVEWVDDNADCSVCGPGQSAAHGDLDLRRLSLSRPSRYRRKAPRCATWPNSRSNGSSHAARRSNQTGAFRGSSTAQQRTENPW